MTDDPTPPGPGPARAGSSDSDATRSRLVLLGAVFGLLGVALGAFGAHALETRLEADRLAIFETAVRYQLIHAVALLAIAGLADWRPGRIRLAGTLMAVGIVVFSGSLFVLVGTGIGAFGAITPFGGVAFLAGWVVLGLAALSRTRDSR